MPKSDENPASPLAAAIEAHQAGRYPEAEGLYQGWLAEHPDDCDGLHLLGMLRFQQTRTAEAVDLIRQSLQNNPRNAHAWNNLGNILFVMNRQEAAADAYLRALELDISLPAPWKNLGECLERAGSPEKAITLFRHIIETVPGFVPAYEALGRLLRVFGRKEEAREVYRRWLELEPGRHTAQHLLAAVTGENVPERASDAYMRELFDGFAEEFDTKLARLDYKAPSLVCGALERVLGPSRTGLRILDAGCGTGLCAPLLRPLASELVGIDLSAGMLTKAQQRGGYDRLEQAELTAYLRDNAGRFDVVTCVDTLCYFGDLLEVFTAAGQALRSGGLFAFSLERVTDPAEPAYHMEHHGRYQHAPNYVNQALAEAGLSVLHAAEEVLRLEVFRGVPGLVVVARAAPQP
jgi:predicted TPR repeat methyltransferase